LLLFTFGLVDIRGGRVVSNSWTLEHYARVLGDPFYYRIFLRTLWMGLGATILCLIFGYPVAYLFTRVGPAVRQGLLVMILAALERQDRSLHEAAAGLGATWAQTFFHVVVPLSLPGILTGSALVFVISYTNFAVPALLGGGSFAVIPTFIFEQISALLQWNNGAVLASLLLGTAMAMLWLFNRTSARL